MIDDEKEPDYEIEVVEDQEEPETPEPEDQEEPEIEEEEEETPEEPDEPEEPEAEDESGLEDYRPRKGSRAQRRITGLVSQNKNLEAQLDAAMQQINRFQQQLTESTNRHNSMEDYALAEAEKRVEAELARAEAEFEAAEEDVDTKRKREALKRLTAVEVERQRVAELKAQRAEQAKEKPTSQQQMPSPSQRALKWQKQNPWFGQDKRLTAIALTIDQELRGQGYVPDTDAYYDAVNKEIRPYLPQKTKPRTTQVTTSARGSRAETQASPGKMRVKVTKRQLAFAKKYGIAEKDLVREVAKLQAERR